MRILMIGILIIWIGWNILYTTAFIKCKNQTYDLKLQQNCKNVHILWFKIKGKTIGDILFRYILNIWFTIIVLFIKLMKIKVSI